MAEGAKPDIPFFVKLSVVLGINRPGVPTVLPAPPLPDPEITKERAALMEALRGPSSFGFDYVVSQHEMDRDGPSL